MDRQEELAVGRRLIGHIDGRTTDLADALFRNRTVNYSCRERAALERERLFRALPIFMGLSTRLPKPGDYLTEDVAGMPVLMTRGADGQVRAFANICRHRGAPVASGCGNARAFICPYHGWTYDFAGKLLGTTDKVGFAGLDLGDARAGAAAGGREARHALYPRAAGRRGDRHRCGARARSRATSRRSSSRPIRFIRPTSVTPRINWKFAIDTFLEGYHIPHLHRKTIAPYFVGNCGVFKSGGLNGRLSVPKTSIESQRARARERARLPRHVVSIYQLFPNALLIWQLDHIEIWRAFPDRDDPSRCEVEMTIYRPARPRRGRTPTGRRTATSPSAP